MFCAKCGSQIDDAAVICPKCGVPVAGRSSPITGARVPNHMVGAVITLIYCLIPGIIALIYANQVNSKLAQGDYEGAVSASKIANCWIIVGAALAVIVILFGMINGMLGNNY